MLYKKKSDNVYAPVHDSAAPYYALSYELVDNVLNRSLLSKYEAIEWLRRFVELLDQNPYLMSSSLAKELYDQALNQFICPRCGAELENLPYMVRQQQDGYNYECPECGEQY
jgi:predicted RNA-binding Zn-ribbon protein involved in translation (DUF1610 family)